MYAKSFNAFLTRVFDSLTRSSAHKDWLGEKFLEIIVSRSWSREAHVANKLQTNVLVFSNLSYRMKHQLASYSYSNLRIA